MIFARLQFWAAMCTRLHVEGSRASCAAARTVWEVCLDGVQNTAAGKRARKAHLQREVAEEEREGAEGEAPCCCVYEEGAVSGLNAGRWCVIVVRGLDARDWVVFTRLLMGPEPNALLRPKSESMQNSVRRGVWETGKKKLTTTAQGVMFRTRAINK